MFGRRNRQPRLTVELVPATCWYSNLRSELPKEQWDLLRRAVYRQARNRCEVCGGRGSAHPVECHEVWLYDDHRHVQKLQRMIALCPACHESKHMAHANVTGNGARARRHLAHINRSTASQVDEHLERAFAVWQQRSQHPWQLDLSTLAAYGIDPPGGAHTNPTIDADPDQGGVTIRALDAQQATRLLRDLGAID
jgi:hypothetical protein